MNESKQNNSSNFSSKDEAFEYLIQQGQNKLLKDQWKKELEQLPDATYEMEVGSKRIGLRRIVAVAASFIILLGSFYWFTSQQDSLQQMASVMLEDTKFILESDSDTRGLQNDLVIELQKEIDAALKKQDYKTAVDSYHTKEKEGQLSTNDKFYYAMSLAKVKDSDPHKAIRLLDDVINKNDKLYNEALWLQGLLYLKINERNKSKIILNKLINKSNYQLSNIEALLERMAD